MILAFRNDLKTSFLNDNQLFMEPLFFVNDEEIICIRDFTEVRFCWQLEGTKLLLESRSLLFQEVQTETVL